jgi:hypothetical protein
MVVHSYSQYKTLPRVQALEPGDVMLKKAFSEIRKGAIEWVITTGQRLFEGGEKFKTGGFFSREKFRVAYLGSHTSEHAAVALSADEIAEAVGEGVTTASVQGRRHERYIIYRCRQPRLRDAAVKIAKGLSDAYHFTIAHTGNGTRQTTGGQYSAVGAFTSLLRGTTFQGESTHQFLTHVVDYVFGLRRDRPNLFCSQFAATVYEAGALAEFGKTAFGSNPQAMSPMELENILNGRGELFTLVGKYDSEQDELFSAIERGMKTYGDRWHFNQSAQSKNAFKILHNLMEIGDNDYLLAAVAALLNARPSAPLSIRCVLPDDARLSKTSSFYRDLAEAIRPTGLLMLA